MNPDQIQARAMHDMLLAICEKLGIAVDSEIATQAKNNAKAEKRYERIRKGELSQDGEELAPKSGRRITTLPVEDDTETPEEGADEDETLEKAPVSTQVTTTTTRKPSGRPKK
jgi:hypothetical protein